MVWTLRYQLFRLLVTTTTEQTDSIWTYRPAKRLIKVTFKSTFGIYCSCNTAFCSTSDLSIRTDSFLGSLDIFHKINDCVNIAAICQTCNLSQISQINLCKKIELHNNKYFLLHNLFSFYTDLSVRSVTYGKSA